MTRLFVIAVAATALLGAPAGAETRGNQVIFCKSHKGAQFIQRLHTYMADNIDRKTGDFTDKAIHIFNKFRSKLSGCVDLSFDDAVKWIDKNAVYYVLGEENRETIDGKMALIEVDGQKRFVADYDGVAPYGFSKIIVVKTSLATTDYPPLGGKIYFPWIADAPHPTLVWKRH